MGWGIGTPFWLHLSGLSGAHVCILNPAVGIGRGSMDVGASMGVCRFSFEPVRLGVCGKLDLGETLGGARVRRGPIQAGLLGVAVGLARIL